jgi:hypothetical protein
MSQVIEGVLEQAQGTEITNSLLILFLLLFLPLYFLKVI